MSIISDMIMYIHLAYGLRSFLSHNISLEQSKKTVSARFRNREATFLILVKKGIYNNAKSPYLKLLKLAGCEFGDIEFLVNRDGIEATLCRLLSEGVYLSLEEFKGGKDIVRGVAHFQFCERDFDNPFVPNSYQVQSSGTRSAGTRTTLDLRHLLIRSYYRPLWLAVNNGLDAPIGLWQAGLPSSAGITALLAYSIIGKPVAKWFSPVTENQVQASLRDRLAIKYITKSARIWGAKLATPEYIGLQDAVTVAQWIAETREQFGSCSLECFVNPAIMVCLAAIENEIDIQGTHFFVGGEPLTESKRRQIESAGAFVSPSYAMTETGFIGCGCLESSVTDDVHLFRDSVALIQRNRKVDHTDSYVNALLVTSLMPSAPKILLNVESGDYGVIETKTCGCLFNQMGFNQHLNSIRSFSKLSGSGMTIFGSDFVRILEEVLPQKYGGTVTDYQLLEEEDRHGETFLSLVISPKVGVVDDDAVISTVFNELRKTGRGGKLAAGFWSQMKTVQIKRMYPIASSGKVMTLHLLKKQ